MALIRPAALTPGRGPLIEALLITGTSQLGIQLLTFAAGIVILRNLPPTQYAYYTIVNTVVGAMTVLTDSGAGSAVLTQAGRVWTKPDTLGSVIATGLYLRRRLAILAAGAGIPAVIFLLHRQHAAWLAVLILTASALPSFYLTVSAQMLEIVPRLHQQVAPLQRNMLLMNGSRVALLAMFIGRMPLAAVACLITAGPQAWSNWQLRRMAGQFAHWHAPPDPGIRELLTAQIRRTMPSAIYFALSGQITVWLVAAFGGTVAVAAVGALGRLAVAFGLLTTVFSIVAVPRYARLPAEDSGRIHRRYWQVQAALMLACALPLLVLHVAPGPILSILGPHYSGYTSDALLMATGGAMSVMNSAALGLAAARGIVMPPLLSIPAALLLQVLLILVLPVGTVAGVLWLGLISATIQWLMLVAYFEWRIRRGG